MCSTCMEGEVHVCVCVLLLHQGKLREDSAGTEWGLRVHVCGICTMVTEEQSVLMSSIFSFNKQESEFCVENQYVVK